MTLDLEDQVDNYKQEVVEYRRQLNDQNNRSFSFHSSVIQYHYIILYSFSDINFSRTYLFL